MVGLSRPCRGEVVPSPCAAVFGLTFPYPQHILYYIRPRVLRSCSTVHMVLEHFRIVVTPKLPMHETIASIPRKAEVVPIPVCPSGNGPGIILCIKKPVPCLTSRGPRARSRDPRAGPQICPSPKQLIFLHTACEVAVKPPEKPCAPAVSQFKAAYKCCFQASQPTVHSSGAISVKRRGSSQQPCAPGVSLLLGRLYTAWGDFLPLPCFAVCRRGWADFTPGGSR